jgi:flagellar hook-associated protein 1 FlgK
VTIGAALSIATSGLANVNRQMALVSQNVANASTPGYSAQIGTQQSMVAAGEGLGVRTGLPTRDVDAALQAEVYNENATVAGLQTRQQALQAIDAVQGTPGQGSDIASQLANLQNQFSTLLNDPSSPTQQSQVVSAASTLASTINLVSNTYTAQRQSAEDNIVSEVTTLNSTLSTIGDLSRQIVTLKASGQSTADLENQRDAAVGSLSQLLNVKVLAQQNGDVLITTSTGLQLPTTGGSPFSTSGATMQPGSYYPATVPAIMLGTIDVTGQLQGGQIGSNITLRDKTLPTGQAELDEFSQNLASRFDAQGLTLFTDPAGNVPQPSAAPQPWQNAYVGFSGTIQVNPQVQTTPSLVRDGTSGANATGSAGFTAQIQKVLTYTFGAYGPTSQTTGLGPAGNLSAPYVAPPTLSGMAAAMVASQAQDSAATSSQLSTEQAVQTNLTSKLSSESGVNMDTEMSNMIQLQNAYGANAKIIATVQAMWTQLLDAVP